MTAFVTGAQNNSVGESVGASGYLQAGTCCKVGRIAVDSPNRTRIYVLLKFVALSRSHRVAMVQHFAAYDIENIPTSRQTFNAELTSRDMWETCASTAISWCLYTRDTTDMQQQPTCTCSPGSFCFSFMILAFCWPDTCQHLKHASRMGDRRMSCAVIMR